MAHMIYNSEHLFTRLHVVNHVYQSGAIILPAPAPKFNAICSLEWYNYFHGILDICFTENKKNWDNYYRVSS